MDILINNAGTVNQRRAETVDGFEITLRPDDMHLRRHKWTPMGAYGRSKLAVML